MGSGRVIEGRFELGDRVKRHEPGESFNAVDRSGGQDVVLRILPGTFGDEARQTAFFERIQSVVKMNGKHLEKVLDAGVTEGGAPYVVTERLKGSPLDQIIGREAPLAVMRAVEICRQIAFGLGDASRAGCVHGRLSPRLVSVSAGKRGKGVEKVKITGYAPWDLADSRAAFDFEVIAPEVILGAEPDIRSDCYAMGVILYSMLAGRSPFTAASREALTLAHLNDRIDVPSVARGDKEIPPALDNLVMRLLEKNPDKRLGAPDIVLVHLESIRSGEQDSGIEPQDGEHPSGVAAAADSLPDADSDLDEGISFASGRRIKTTDFQSIKVTELMGSIAGREVEPTAPLGRLDPVHAPAAPAGATAAAKPLPDASAVPAKAKGHSSTLAIVVVSGLFFLAAVAVTGWFVLQYQTRKLELAAQSAPAAAQVQTAEPVRQAAAIAPAPATVPATASDSQADQGTQASPTAGQMAAQPVAAQPVAASPNDAQPTVTPPAAASADAAQAVAPAQPATTKAQATAPVKTEPTDGGQAPKQARPVQAQASSTTAKPVQQAASGQATAPARKPQKTAAVAAPKPGKDGKPTGSTDKKPAPAAAKPATASGGSSVDWFDGMDEKPAAKPAAKDKPKKDSGKKASEPVLNWDE